MQHRKPEFTFKSDAGLLVEVFRLQPEDAAYLVDLFEHMSVTSRYQRFNQYLANVDWQMVEREAEHLSIVDPARGLGLLAFADLPDQPHAPVGGARYVRTEEDEYQAEISVAVRDDLQGQGIGGQLLHNLVLMARAAGVHALVGTFHTANRRIWDLLAESPFQVHTEIDGVQTSLTIDLRSLRSAPADDGMASTHQAAASTNPSSR